MRLGTAYLHGPARPVRRPAAGAGRLQCRAEPGRRTGSPPTATRRRAAIDPIDWIELIPFNETRNYVQRVVENVVIYRARGRASPRRTRSLQLGGGAGT